MYVCWPCIPNNHSLTVNEISSFFIFFQQREASSGISDRSAMDDDYAALSDVRPRNVNGCNQVASHRVIIRGYIICLSFLH